MFPTIEITKTIMSENHGLVKNCPTTTCYSLISDLYSFGIALAEVKKMLKLGFL